MKKLLYLLEKWYYENKKPSYATMSDMETLWCVYRDLKQKGSAEFIQDYVRYMLVECDLIVDKKGIGYIATIPGK